MEVQPLLESDIEELREIHNRFYKYEFSFPDFLNGFLVTFVIRDQDGSIITAGGVRPIPEIILITDQTKFTLERRLALANSLEISEYICKRHGYSGLHAFVKDPKWANRLIKTGFRPIEGKGLYLEL